MAEVELSDPIGALRGDLRKKGELYARMGRFVCPDAIWQVCYSEEAASKQ